VTGATSNPLPLRPRRTLRLKMNVGILTSGVTGDTGHGSPSTTAR
jgi:hypothetical protein